jgi:hypothetical protein
MSQEAMSPLGPTTEFVALVRLRKAHLRILPTTKANAAVRRLICNIGKFARLR